MADQEFELTAKLRIRPAEARDAKDLHTYCFTNDTLEDITTQLNQDLERAKNGELYRIVVEASGHAVGNIRVERHKLDHALGEISQLTVSAPFRTFGVAARLIEATEQVSQENGIKVLQIQFPKDDAQPSIIEAYRNWGFAEPDVLTLQKSVGASGQESEETSTPETPAQAEAQPKGSGDEGEQQRLL